MAEKGVPAGTDREPPASLAPASPSPLIAAQAPPKKAQGREKAAPAAAGDGSAQALTKARPAAQPPPRPPAGSTLYLRIDERMLALLRENPNPVWTDPDRIARFLELIRDLVTTETVPDQVAWAGPYPEELLREGGTLGLMMTIENGRAVLELKGD